MTFIYYGIEGTIYNNMNIIIYSEHIFNTILKSDFDLND